MTMTDTMTLPDGMIREDPPEAARRGRSRYGIREKLVALQGAPNEWYRIHTGKDPANLVYGHLRNIAGKNWKSKYDLRTAATLPNGDPLPEGQRAVWVRYIGS